MNPTVKTLRVESFEPTSPFRNPHVQSVAAGLRMRRWVLQARRDPMGASSESEILTLEDGVRLAAHISRQPKQAASKGVFVLVHGWEGSHLSVYIYSMAVALFEAGYDIVRLNLRDHGDTHALNAGLFHAWCHNDLSGAIRALKPRFSGPMRLIGYSLGGNFALRATLALGDDQALLQGVYAICPVINPAAVVRAIDEGQPLYRTYFLRKWHRSLQAKQACFPERYNVDGLFDHKTFEAVSRDWIERGYGPCDTLEGYFDGYRICASDLDALSVPITVITAALDPIIPVADFHDLSANNPHVSVRIAKHGGHCGFMERLPFRCWLERELLASLPA